MKTKCVLMTLIAAMFLTWAVAPVHAGYVLLMNDHKTNIYAIEVTYVHGAYWTCANPQKGEQLFDPPASIRKIEVFRAEKCILREPVNLLEKVAPDYIVPGTPNPKRRFSVTVYEDGRASVRESPY